MNNVVDSDLHNCNFSKTILMLAVVLCHSAAYFGGNWFVVCPLIQVERPLGILSSWLGTFHVSGFTLISGYIYYYSRYERCKYSNGQQFLKNKLRRLLLPYLFVSLVWVIPIGQLFYNYNLSELVHKYLLGQSPSQLWFLLMLFGTFVLAYYLLRPHKTKRNMIIVVLSFILGTVLSQITPNIFQIYTSTKFLLFFYIGFMIREKSKNLTDRTLLIWGGLALFLNVLCYVLSQRVEIKMCALLGSFVNILLKTSSEVFGALMAFLLLNLLARYIDWDKHIFKSLYRYSFPIYLFHQQIIYILIWYLNGTVPPTLLVFISVIGSVSFSLLLSVVFVKYRDIRILVGM